MRHMIQTIARWLGRPDTSETVEPSTVMLDQAAEADWLASLPSDVQDLIHARATVPIAFLMQTAALTPPSDRADAVRRWITLPDAPPVCPADATVAERLETLFRTQLRPDGTAYTEQDIAVAFDGAVSADRIAQLRHGTITAPDPRTLLRVARFFHVSPLYFYPGVHMHYVTGPLDPTLRRATERLLYALTGTAPDDEPRDPDARPASQV